MIRGTVLFHENFKFPDGEYGEKLLIILNTPTNSEPYLVCKTTSKCQYLIMKEGCHSEKGIYHIKANKDGFKLDTWVQLNPIIELKKEELLKAHLQDKKCHKVHCISDTLIRAILNCIWKSDDVTQYQLDLLFKN